MMHVRKTLTLAMLALNLSSCGTLSQYAESAGQSGAELLQGGVRAGASAALPIGREEEKAYGGAIAVMIVQKYGGLYEEPAVAQYVQLVGNAVALHAHRPDLDWHFGVLDSEAVNALSAPGGYVFVTRGALKLMRDESELAGVLAHEIGHVDAQHALDDIKKLKARGAMAQAAADAWKDNGLFSQLLDQFLTGYLDHGLAPEAEFEADQLGTELLRRVGWQPAGLRTFLQRMAEAEQKGPQDAAFYRTHPKTSERVARLDKQIAGMRDAGGATLAERFATSMRPVQTPATVP
jgi:predicted Zn-dependent protease